MSWLRRNLNTALILGCLIVAGVATYIRYEPARDSVTRITASPCQKDPSSKECADLRQEIVESEPIRVACTSFRRIVRPPSVLEKFTRCKGPAIKSPGDRKRAPDDVPTQGPGQDRTERPQAPVPSGSVPGPDGGTGSGDTGGVPDSPSPDPDPAPPQDPPPAPAPTPSPPEPDNGTVGGLGIETPLDPTVCTTAPILCE